MRLKSPLLTKVAGLAATMGIRGWMRTLDYKSAYYDPSVDPVNPRYRERALFVLWHEYLLIPLYMRGRCNVGLLMSRHRDADVLSRVAFHFGFEFVRGSTARGGDQALRELVRLGRSSNLAITPDGPRGPRRRMAAGPIYLASKLGMPIVLMGFGLDRPWRLPTWDRFAVPRPGTRARTIFSPHIRLPADLDREGIEHYRQRLEKFLLRLTAEAESWAESGTAKLGQVPAIPGPPPLRSSLAGLEAWWRGEPADSPEIQVAPAPSLRDRAA